MPTLSVSRDQLFSRLGKKYTEEEFDEVCFQFGVELDEVLTEKEAAAARQLRGDDAAEAGSCSSGTDADVVAGEGVLFYIAIPANRTDLLCLEGFARALNVFLGNAPLPVRVFPRGICAARRDMCSDSTASSLCCFRRRRRCHHQCSPAPPPSAGLPA